MMIANNDSKNIESSEVKKLDNNELGEVSGGVKLGDPKEKISMPLVAYGSPLTAPKLRLPLKTKPTLPLTKYGVGIPTLKEKPTRLHMDYGVGIPTAAEMILDKSEIEKNDDGIKK